MDANDEAESPDNAGNDSFLAPSFFAELERVIGRPADGSDPDVKIQWLLPVSGFGELLEVLRGVPTGLGQAGLEQLLRERFGTLSGLKRVYPKSDEADDQ